MWGNFDKIINNLFITHSDYSASQAFSIINNNSKQFLVSEAIITSPTTNLVRHSVNLCDGLSGSQASGTSSKMSNNPSIISSSNTSHSTLLNMNSIQTCKKPLVFHIILHLSICYNFKFHTYSINLNPDHKTLTWYRRLKPPLWLSYYNLP